MKKEKKIFVYAIFKDAITMKYEVKFFAAYYIDNLGTNYVWSTTLRNHKFVFNFPSVRKAKKLIRTVLCNERPPEYACIVVNGKLENTWWTHTKKHIETMAASKFKRELFANSGVIAEEIFKGLWSE